MEARDALTRARPSVGQVLREPTVPVLLLATVAHVLRHNLTDIVLFLGLAGLVVVDSRRGGPARQRDLPRLSTPVVLGVGAGYGLLVAPLARGGATLRVVLAVPGAVALLTLWRSSRDQRDVRRPTRWWWWPALILSVCLVELTNFLLQPSFTTSTPDHPVLSTIIEPWLSSGPARGVTCAVWLAIGWWLTRVLVGRSEP